MEKIDGNTFGSGFVYVAPDGTNYIVTNRHVVSSCEKASVQFEQEDGSYKTYNNLKVLASDRDLDLALLSFPEGEKPFARGMSISSLAVSDGEEVWSAGFPGLGAEPSWQLGKGTVTNATTRIKALIDPSITTLIQHSAPVDSGNSGGPLLRKNSKGSYEVVGVNTWKINLRQSTNISMPVSSLKKFIEKATSTPAPQSLEKRIDAFAKELKEDELSCNKIEKFLSKKYVEKSGAKT
ncbi:MAG: trypsin-like peptidase domain-containing protein, partial [Treponema sp.]|nr:trypsin-like peptidase domain-containing protein [Treponema sp.]